MKIIERIFKSSPVSLAVYLFSLGCFYLFTKLLGYTFVPINVYVVNIFSAAIIIILTVGGIINRKAKTKLSITLSALLPLIVIFFVFSKGLSWNPHGIDNTVHTIHAIITSVCSMMLFFVCGKGIVLKIFGGIFYLILLYIVLFYLLFAHSFRYINNTPDFGFSIPYRLLLFEKIVEQSLMSPNGVYLVEVGEVGDFASCSYTYIEIISQNNCINLLVCNLKKDGKWVYWGTPPFNPDLRWETDEILYIYDIPYNISELLNQDLFQLLAY